MFWWDKASCDTRPEGFLNHDKPPHTEVKLIRQFFRCLGRSIRKKCTASIEIIMFIIILLCLDWYQYVKRQIITLTGLQPEFLALSANGIRTSLSSELQDPGNNILLIWFLISCGLTIFLAGLDGFGVMYSSRDPEVPGFKSSWRWLIFFSERKRFEHKFSGRDLKSKFPSLWFQARYRSSALKRKSSWAKFIGLFMPRGRITWNTG